MWEISLADQIKSALQSLPLGIAPALVFFTVESFHTAFKSTKIRVFISDILFFIVAAFITFCFLLISSNGEIRGYILIGEGIGFFIFKALFSKYYIKFLSALIALVNSFFEGLAGAVRGLFEKIAERVQKSLEKLKNNRKKGLKNEE